jgi:hypothetical protein
MGPLQGIKVVEFAGIGPGPFCCMLLADMGADVVRIDRTEPADLGNPTEPKFNLLTRGRRSIALDLKKPADIAVAKALVEKADALVEGFRPGVMERLGLGPDTCLKANPRLVYGRMTGWGQEGPLAPAAGHDINYIALVGALNAIGPKNGPPVPPLNLVGLRRRRALSRVRARLRTSRSQDLRQGSGGRRRHGRRRGFADHQRVRRHRIGSVGQSARLEFGRWRRAFLRHLRNEGRQIRFHRVDRSPLL